MLGINEKKVLVVEDNTSLQKLLASRIVTLGVDVTSVGTAQEALTFMNDKTPDLIVLDIMLPGGMNGFDFLKKIKGEAKFKKIPVIVLTNLDTEQKTAMELGAVDYAVKNNISLDEMLTKIENNLNL